MSRRGLLYAVVLFLVLSVVNCDTVSACDQGWINANSNCYFFESKRRVTWSQANDECKNYNAMRLRFESTDELNWFIGYAQANAKSDGYWTDLNDLPVDGSSLQGNGHWHFGTDEFPIANLILWNISPQNDGISKCAGVNIQGKMEDTNCFSQQSYICEAPMVGGNCVGKGWLSSSTNLKCYWIANTTLPIQMLTWDNARTKCGQQATQDGYSKGDLVSVDDDDDQTFLLGELPFLTQSTKLYWTGLYYANSQWNWVNGQPVNTKYFQWVQEPDNIGGIESCAMVRMNGNFSDQNCQSNHNFICMKPQSVAYALSNMGCGQWTRAGRKCYHFYNGPKLTWVNARGNCQSLGGDLLKVENKDEKTWITSQMVLTTDSFWTGLNDRAQEGTYVWADSASSQDQLVMWNQEPNDYMGQEDCGIIFSNGGYNDANCAAKAAFICELQYQGTTCPTGWVSRTTSQMLDCYFISDYKNNTMMMTWSEALGYCASQAPSQSATSLLLSVDDADEKAFIEQQLSTLDRNFGGWWTGLNDKDREGYWTFYGQTVMASASLIPWTSEPDNRFKDEDCTIINWSGHYLTLPCDDQNGYICERYAPSYKGYKGYKGAANGRSYTWTNVMICFIVIVFNGLF